jgi:hypothetical protein
VVPAVAALSLIPSAAKTSKQKQKPNKPVRTVLGKKKEQKTWRKLLLLLLMGQHTKHVLYH